MWFQHMFSLKTSTIISVLSLSPLLIWSSTSFYMALFVLCHSGEDLNSKARNKYQAEQLREWALEQQRERDQAQKNQDTADRLYELKMRELDQRALDLQRAEEECRKAINLAQADYNQALVRYLMLAKMAQSSF